MKILIPLLLLASSAFGSPAGNYIYRCHLQAVHCRPTLSSEKAEFMASGFKESAIWCALYFGLDQEALYDRGMAVWTWEHYFVSAVTSRGKRGPLPEKRWSYSPTQLTVETANDVVRSWRGSRHIDHPKIRGILKRYPGQVDGWNLLNDMDLYVWAGTYHLASEISRYGFDGGTKAYNAGPAGARAGYADRYLATVKLIEQNRHLWREGIFLREGTRHEESLFDIPWFVCRLVNGCRSCGGR